jgi:hypothetical protein
MTYRLAPADEPFDRWLETNVRPGDTVRMVEGARYPIVGVTVTRLDNVTIRADGAALQGGPQRPFELVQCRGWQVYDLVVDGGRPPGATPTTAEAARHGFAIRGCDGILLKRCRARNVWGDGLYIGNYTGPNRNLVACDHTVEGSGRHGVTTISAEGTVIYRPHLVDVARTGFNFEVHPDQTVTRWACEDARIDRVGIKVLTATGEGDATAVSFDGISLPGDKHWDPAVYGAGDAATPGDRAYGRRADWTIRRVRGAKAVTGTKIYARLLNVDGLALDDVPYPADTTGSTPA